jgi:hypothetical protein
MLFAAIKSPLYIALKISRAVDAGIATPRKARLRPQVQE